MWRSVDVVKLWKSVQTNVLAMKAQFIVLTLIAYLATLITSVLSFMDSGAFENTYFEVYEKNYLEAIPSEWALTLVEISALIWMGLGVIYAHSTLCRRLCTTPLYKQPVYPTLQFFIFILASLFAIGFRITFSYEMFEISLALITLTVLLVGYELYISVAALSRNLQLMYDEKLRVDVWLIRIFTQNGTAFGAFWKLHLILLNLGVLLTHTKIGVAASTSSSIILGGVIGAVLLWFILDITVLDKFTRYLLTPYMVFTIFGAGILIKKGDFELDWSTNAILAYVLSGLASTLSAAKLLIMAQRAVKRPIAPAPAI